LKLLLTSNIFDWKQDRVHKSRDYEFHSNGKYQSITSPQNHGTYEIIDSRTIEMYFHDKTTGAYTLKFNEKGTEAEVT
jgi:hypothetical protein